MGIWHLCRGPSTLLLPGTLGKLSQGEPGLQDSDERGRWLQGPEERGSPGPKTQGISQMSWTEGCHWGGTAGTQVLPELTRLEADGRGHPCPSPKAPHPLLSKLSSSGLGALTESSGGVQHGFLFSRSSRNTLGGTHGAENSGYSRRGWT